jgi:ankyrin repeat protein
MSKNSKTQEEITALNEKLILSVRQEDAKETQKLIDQGADVNAVSQYGGQTPLMFAAAYGKIETMKLLIEHGADVNARDNNMGTPIMYATQQMYEKSEKTILLLVDKGANINAIDSEGNTALMKSGSADINNLLITKGANVNITNNAGKTYEQIIIDDRLGRKTESKDQLSSKGWKEGSSSIDTEDYSADINNLLITKGANVGITNNAGKTYEQIIDDRLGRKTESKDQLSSKGWKEGSSSIDTEDYKGLRKVIKPSDNFYLK